MPVYDYDLISAFPNIAKDLIDTRDCWWKESARYVTDALYGYVRCKVTIWDWVMVHPIIQETEEGCLSPTGTWEAYLTKGELDFITKWGIGTWSIIEGIWAIPVTGRELRKPLLEPMTQLLKYKQGSELQKLIAKRSSTGIYGKFGEEWDEEFGPHFFPPWFAEIAVRAKLEVAELLYQNKIGPEDNEGYRKLIHIGVDGVMLTEPLEIDDKKWREEYRGAALVFSSGLVYTNTTKPKGLSLDEVLQMIGEHPRTCYYQKKLVRRLTLADSLSRRRLNDIGKPFKFNVSLSFINQRHDRIFNKLPSMGEQLANHKYRPRPMEAIQEGA